MEDNVHQFSSKKSPTQSRKYARRDLGFNSENNSMVKLQRRCPKGDQCLQPQSLSSHHQRAQDSNSSCSEAVNVKQQATVMHKETSTAGRERLKRHREEVAGRVVIPDTWGQESSLHDWIDYSPFDKLLAPNGITSAREALIAEGRGGPSSHQRLRIESRC
ncbi:hypothetical protein Tsubulata_010235 [Turnera subulata]|uniref:Protein BIC1 n=1 Tax=Turnera subulata TaxID=218843 RepID=A0A9Q0JN59_9ROSI|nr:hypothetical protein Tsubulata_010235 [Turnera subulata]